MKWFTAREEKHNYLVVQDMRPFGYRIISSHRTLTGARLAAMGSSYRKVETREWVEREEKRLEDHDQFMATLNLTVALDKKGVPYRNYSQST